MVSRLHSLAFHPAQMTLRAEAARSFPVCCTTFLLLSPSGHLRLPSPNQQKRTQQADHGDEGAGRHHGDAKESEVIIDEGVSGRRWGVWCVFRIDCGVHKSLNTSRFAADVDDRYGGAR